jgi:23S rRNA (uridine2552-2'-O)-methyltransferase
MTIVDLGSSPGSWSQYAASCVRKRGHVFANDILPMKPIINVNFLKGDLNNEDFFELFMSTISQNKIHVVMSDMAPNLTGIPSVDAPRSISLVRLGLKVCRYALSHGGSFLVKIFQSECFESCLSEVKTLFTEVKIRKPNASRPSSREMYLLARGWKA